MATKKTVKAVVETTAEAEDVARKIWLAGVGAYGRMFAEAQDRVEKYAGSANDLFEQLVARGEALEDKVRERLEANEATQKLGAAIGKMQDFRSEQRAALKARVETFRKGVDAYNPLLLTKQVQELTARLDALEGKTPARAAAKRVSAPKRTKR